MAWTIEDYERAQELMRLGLAVSPPAGEGA